MRSFSDLTGREKLVEILRWFCVLPAAFVGDYIASSVFRYLLSLASKCGLAIIGVSTFADGIGLVLSYGPPKTIFVLVGSQVAPRRQLTISIVLAFLGIGLSLMTNVVGQFLVGNRVGIVNYGHFSAEFLGLLCGPAYLILQRTRNCRNSMSDVLR
ncbi:MAG TPA: hypothetical protein VL132_23730 [Planctomycetaceae bacterium]|nr:hypothetical protein [Planctomycetaceae bacterium]